MHSQHLLHKPHFTYVEKGQRTFSLSHRWAKVKHGGVTGTCVRFLPVFSLPCLASQGRKYENGRVTGSWTLSVSAPHGLENSGALFWL